ncbi:MAG: hypothetical protein ABI148_06410, partial [Ginsengibacter sp.]
DIYLLVRGLSSSEKSYYKKMAKRHANQNASLHLKLFKLIDDGNVEDEDELCDRLEIENRIHFSGLKTYLHKDILDTLVFQKRNKSVDTRLYFIQDQIRALQEKNLLSLAQKLCRRGITLATQYEKYHFLILLLHLQNRVVEYKNYKQYKTTTDTVFSNMQAAIKSQKIFTENRFLYENTRRLTYRTWLPITQDELAEITEAKTLLKTVKPSNDNQPLISLFYLNTLALCQYMLHENSLCTQSCRKIYNLWNTSPHLINEYPLLFLNSINTTCYNDFLSNDLRNVKGNIAAYGQMIKVHLKNEIYHKHFEVINFNTAVKVYLKTAQFDQLKKLIDLKSATIFTFSTQILAPADRLSILSSVCIAYFVLQQWDDAESLLLLIKELNRKINREDILYFSLLFYLAILYEQKEWYRLDSALEAAYHRLYDRKKLRSFERELMLFLGQLSTRSPKSNPNKLIKYFLKRLDKYKDDPGKNLYFLYFNYYGWLESKLMNLRYMDYISLKIVEPE